MTDQNIKGRIQQINDRSFTVVLNSDEACHSCGLSGVCSDKKIEFQKKEVTFDPTIGQMVEVGYKKLLQTSFIVYMVPLLFFFAGIFITGILFRSTSEIWQFLGAIIGTGIGLALVAVMNKKLTSEKYTVNIKAI